MPDLLQSPEDTPLAIRPFQNADADAVARLVTASVRGYWIYRPAQFRESADPRRRRLVAVRESEDVATAHLSPFGDATPDALRLDLAGAGEAFTALYLALLSGLPGGCSRLLGVTREDFDEQMAFFHAAGFRNAWQSWGAHLELRQFEPARFQPLEQRLFLEGFEMSRLASVRMRRRHTGTRSMRCMSRVWPTRRVTRPPRLSPWVGRPSAR